MRLVRRSSSLNKVGFIQMGMEIIALFQTLNSLVTERLLPREQTLPTRSMQRSAPLLAFVVSGPMVLEDRWSDRDGTNTIIG